jgi:hypothetical protein
MRERTMPSNIRRRAQAEAAILRAKEIKNEDPAQVQWDVAASQEEEKTLQL